MCLSPTLASFKSRHWGLTEHEEKTMSIINIALLLNALAQLVTAVAKLVEIRQGRK
jgi:hypothetical protein